MLTLGLEIKHALNKMKKITPIFLATLISITLLFMSLGSFAQGLQPANPAPTVALSWNPSPSVGVANYNVYVGTASLNYSAKIPCGTNLHLTVTAPNLTRGVTSYFNITAADTNGMESVFGGEISYTPIAPLAAPVFKPIVVLIVQSSPSLSSPDWSTLATVSLLPDQASQFFRTSLTLPQP